MSTETELQERSESKCELCTAGDNLAVYQVSPKTSGDSDTCAMLCSTCISQIDDPTSTDANHWRCLNESMWNEHAPVQVLAWRMLTRLSSEGWPQVLLDMFYLDDYLLVWAKASGEGAPKEAAIKHIDSNGAVLNAGDNVTLIKDLVVKGGGFTAKRGAPVRNIYLVHDNAEQIEARVNGQVIVILTKFVKKLN